MHQSNVFKISTILYKLFFQLMHVTDWLPTLITAAGGNGSELASNLDGIDQWSSISTNQKPTRTQIVVNIDEVMKNAAIRDKDWKLVIGEPHATFQISISMCAMHPHWFRIYNLFIRLKFIFQFLEIISFHSTVLYLCKKACTAVEVRR
jgi:hypothetical protein